MMSDNDLHALRGRWSAQGQRLEAGIRLDRDALRRELVARGERAFGRHRLALLAVLAVWLAATIGLLAFVAAHWGQWKWVALALLLLPVPLAEVWVAAAQGRALRGLDIAGPVLPLQQALDRLQARRLMLTRSILLTSVLLWLPFLAVVGKALFGADLLHALPPSVWIAHLLLGVVVVPVGWYLGRWVLPRMVGEQGMRDFLRDAAGRSWRLARQRVDARGELDAAIDSEDSLVFAPLSRSLSQAVARLRLRLLAAAVWWSLLLLAIGLFNAAHGGQWVYFACGVALNLIVVAQLVPTLIHWHGLGHRDGSRQTLRKHWQTLTHVRERVARVTIAVLPTGGLLAAVVLGKALGIAMIDLLPWAAWTGLFAAVLLAGLYAAQRPSPRVVDRVTLGATSTMHGLLGSLALEWAADSDTTAER